jgi:hypothetical protein
LCDRQTLSGNKTVLRGLAVGIFLLALAGCDTTGGKPQQAAAVEAPPRVADPNTQLADTLNAKAETRRLKGDTYRDPLVRSARGAHEQTLTQQAGGAAYFPPAPQMTVASAADTQGGIAGLVTQPTAVNANRSSIYAAPAPIAVNPDGTLADTQPQGITPIRRSVYSLPAGVVLDGAQQAGGQATQAQSSAAVIPPPVIRNAGSPMKPTADATPSKIMPARGSNARHIDSQEALMLARKAASGGQQPAGNPMLMPQGQTGSGL